MQMSLIFCIHQKLNVTLIKINRWFLAKQLINIENKTKFMVFLRRKKLIPTVIPLIYIKIAFINRVNSFKLFGVVLDINLKLEKHVIIDI